MSVTVGHDPTDLRDQIYVPGLRLLGSEGGIAAQRRDGRIRTALRVRNQRDTPHCVGYALAGVIDLHRLKTGGAGRPADPVSASMLYDMAHRIENGGTAPGDGVYSLRSVIKAFYHYGCCPESAWPDLQPPVVDEVERFKAAQGVTLGAYFRVRALLNDYHCALNEADCILVSAELHQGWHAVDGGRIPLSHQGAGVHAFVIVGYGADGFLVLNSWGREWGGYKGLPGVALWRYADWARHVMDAWVLRLGVPAAGAFHVSVGEQGIGFPGLRIAAGSTACHQILGHFAHLDDGVHVEGGSYASSAHSVELTAARLAKGTRPVVLTIGGAMLGLKDAVAVETGRRHAIEAIGAYPYALIWCADLIEGTLPVLSHLIQTVVTRVGPHGETLKAEIERTTKPVGRSFWRDILRAAAVAGRHRAPGADGAAADILDRFAATGRPLHLVVDGAGAVLLAEYLLSLHEHGPEDADRRKALAEGFLSAVASIDLIAPTLEAEAFRRAYGPLLARLHDRGGDRAALWVPARDLEAHLSVDLYEGSLLELVLHGFEGRPPSAAYVGMSQDRARFAPPPGLTIRDIAPTVPGRRRYDYAEVTMNPACHADILQRISQWSL